MASDGRLGSSLSLLSAGHLSRQSVFGRLGGYDDVNDADRLSLDPVMRWIVGGHAVTKQAASSSQMGRFETEVLATEETLAALPDLSGQWIDSVHDRRPPTRIILDMDSSVSPTHGEQEGSAKARGIDPILGRFTSHGDLEPYTCYLDHLIRFGTREVGGVGLLKSECVRIDARENLERVVQRLHLLYRVRAAWIPVGVVNERQRAVLLNIMEMHRYGVRGAIAGDITERLSLFATLRYHEEDGPNDYWGRETNGNNLKFPDTRVNSFNGEHYRETWAWSVQLDYDFDDFTITSITSNTDTNSARESDVDNVQEFVLDLLRIHRIDVVTQELRFTSTGDGPFQWQFGGFYQNYDRDLNGDLYLFGGSSLLFADPASIPDPATETDQGLDFNDPANRDRDDPDAVFLGCSDVTLCDPLVFERSKRQRDSHAVFVNASYRWNAFEFSAGYRADTWESQRHNDDSGVSGKRKQTQNLFRGNVSWFMNDESMFYLTYAQGFEPGDYNLTSFEGVRDLFGYGPERATNYELGYKGRLFDDRVVLTAALFKTDYKDRQAELQLEAPTGEVVEGIINAGDSKLTPRGAAAV